MKGVTKTIKNETKEQHGKLLRMLLGTLGALLSGKGIGRTGYDMKCTFNAASSFHKLWNTKVLSEWSNI